MPKHPSHPIPIGTRVVVINTTASSRPFLEGWCEILAPFGYAPNTYLVRFDNEALPQVRLALRDWQEDPIAALEALRAA